MTAEHCQEVNTIEMAVYAFNMLDRDAAERALVYLNDRYVLSVERPPTKLEKVKAQHEAAIADAVIQAKAEERAKCADLVAEYAGDEVGPARDIAISKSILARTE